MTDASPDAVVRRYLAELGVDSPTVDADGLLALHEAHVHRFAHDTIWISRGRIPPLDGRAFAEALSSGEGGGCLQLTGGFAWLLDALGFDVTLHRARVQRAFDPEPVGPPNAHVTMIVAVDGRRFYADPGLGSALESPVPLEDADIAQGPFRYALHRSPRIDGWVFTHDPRMMSVRAVELEDAASPLSAWADVYEYDTTDPASSYRQRLSAGIRHPDAVSLLMGRSVIRMGSGKRRVEAVATPDGFERLLRDEFRLGLPDLTGEELDALWAKA